MRDSTTHPYYLQDYFTREELTPFLADLYFEAASADEPMIPLAEAFEAFRDKAVGNTDLIPLLSMITGEIGRFRRKESRQFLVDLRGYVYKKADKTIQKRFGDPAKPIDQTIWLNTLAEALAYWEIQLCRSLIAVQPQTADPLNIPFNLAEQLDLVIQEYWISTYPLYSYFSSHPSVEKHLRARLLIPAGQIRLYFFHEPDLALQMFQEADELWPNNGRVQAAFSEYHLHQKSFQEADRFAKMAIDLSPKEAEGYVFLGDIAEQGGQYEEAQSWFETAIEKDPEGTLAYTRLMRLLSRPETIEQHEERILRLLERAIDIDPHSRYVLYLEMGYVYQNGQQYEKALSWLQKAIDLEPNRLGAYLNSGYVHIDMASQANIPEDESGLMENEFLHNLARAEALFEDALSRNPEKYDPYWGLGSAAEIRQDWETALGWYQKILGLPWFKETLRDHPHAKAPYVIQVGKMLRALGRTAEAREALFHALQLDSRGDREILDLADDLSLEEQSIDEAFSIYNEVRRIKGESFEASYQNRVGNLRYAHGDYEAAVEHYQSAINHNDQEPIFFTNLAGAYRNLQRWEPAREALRGAFELDGQENRYHRELAHLYNEEGNGYFQRAQYSEALEGYAKAIELNEKEPVYYSNFALAYENQLDQLGMQAVQKALWALEKAADLVPDNSNYHLRMSRLQALLKVGSAWGEHNYPVLETAPLFSIAFSSDLTDLVFADESGLLTDSYFNNLTSVYAWCKERYGLNISIKTFIEQNPTEKNQFWINLNGIPVASGSIPPNQYLYVGDPQPLFDEKIEALETTNPFNGNVAYLINGAEVPKAAELELYLWTPPGFGLLNLAYHIEQNLSRVLTVTAMDTLLDECGTDACHQILGSDRDLIQFTLVCRALLDDKVSIAALPSCAETFLYLKDQADLSLSNILCALRLTEAVQPLLPGNQLTTELIPVDPSIEQILAEHIVNGGEEPFLAMTPEMTQELLAIVRDHINDEVKGQGAFVVDDPLVRLFFRQIVRLEFPYMWVLTKAEVMTTFPDQPDTARIWGTPLSMPE